jgi:lysozyme family protein
MTDLFPQALVKVLASEGGYSNDRLDPGGSTNKGITQVVYDGYRKSLGLKAASVKNISDAEVSGIYRTRYWNAIKADQLPSGLNYAAFDAAVNSGVTQASKWLQRSVGVADDGNIGPKTLAAIASYPNIDKLIDDVCDRRLAMLKTLSTWKHFGKGWSTRIASVRATAKAWAK